MRKTLTLSATLVAVLSAWGPSAGDDDHDRAFEMRAREEVLPLEQLVEGLGLGPGARILEVETEHEHGRLLYEIEYVESDGRVYEALVDARTGEVLEREED